MISRDFNPLFVHIPKTGGQSVEHVFLQAHGLTWETREPLLLRFNPDPLRGPERLAHLTAEEYTKLGYLSPGDFAKIYKFSIVRNPYSRIVSEYNYRAPERRMPIRDFVFRAEDSGYNDRFRHIIPQVKYITGCDKTIFLVDRIVRFEALAAEMAEVFQHVFGDARPLPHRNKTRRACLQVDALSARDIDFINEYYAEDFARLGYAVKHEGGPAGV